MSQQFEEDELYQKREKIQARTISGFFQRIRVVTIILGFFFFLIGPWLQWGDRQALLFDLPQRKFYIFGLTFWPQDFILLSWLLIILAFSIFFITNLIGRVFCGYLCPQTVWTRLFMWVERLTEGSRLQRLKLDKAPLSFSKFLKRTSKYFLWFVISAITSVTFIAYFTPVHSLLTRLFIFQLGPVESFWIVFFTLATYINAGWMREQICIYVCPYARFQSVMFDENTLTVTYDPVRGEPHGSRKIGIKPRSLGLGDCINCSLCVQVCPTGIDIREGLQIACIGCACCIDACDSIMDKMHYERGLIRYATEEGIKRKPTHLFRLRMVANAIVLAVMVTAFSYVIATRIPLTVNVIHDRNRLFREVSGGYIENPYVLKIGNMSQKEQRYMINAYGMSGLQYRGNQEITVSPGEVLTIPVSLRVNAELIKEQNTKIFFTISNVDAQEVSVTRESRFIAPADE